MNMHVARTPPVCTAVRHTCCQGQTSDLTVRLDAARWYLFVSLKPEVLIDKLPILT